MRPRQQCLQTLRQLRCRQTEATFARAGLPLIWNCVPLPRSTRRVISRSSKLLYSAGAVRPDYPAVANSEVALVFICAGKNDITQLTSTQLRQNFP